MILQDISRFIEISKRVEESVLLKHFHLTQSSLDPMIAVLLKRGKIHKTVNQRGKNLSPVVYYSYHETATIPVMSVL